MLIGKARTTSGEALSISALQVTADVTASGPERPSCRSGPKGP